MRNNWTEPVAHWRHRAPTPSGLALGGFLYAPDRTILGKISKRGNRYLRVLFVQAAWVVLIKPKIWERHGLKPWIEAAKKRLHHNRAGDRAC